MAHTCDAQTEYAIHESASALPSSIDTVRKQHTKRDLCIKLDTYRDRNGSVRVDEADVEDGRRSNHTIPLFSEMLCLLTDTDDSRRQSHAHASILSSVWSLCVPA